MPNRNRGRRNAGRVERGMPMGRAQTPVRARPVEDPVLVVAEAITDSQVVSNLHETSQDHRNTIKQLKERIQDLTKQIKKKNKEISNYRGLEQKVASLQNKIETMETPKIQIQKPTHKDILDMCIESMKKGKMMSDVFGDTLMKLIKESAEELILKKIGVPDMVSLILMIGSMKKAGMLVVKKDQIEVKIDNLNKIKSAVRGGLKEAQKHGYCNEWNEETGAITWNTIYDNEGEDYTLQQLGETLTTQEDLIERLQEENKKLKKQIEEDDILFQDCQ